MIQHTITNLGGLASALAVAAFVILWALAKGQRVSAFLIAGGVIATVVLTAGLKMIAQEAFAEPHLSDAFSLSAGAPSGHAAIAAFVYGGAFLLFTTTRHDFWKLAGLAFSLAAVVGVAVTRVTLDTHTIGDVIAGVGLAALVLAPLAWFLKRASRISAASAGPLLLGMIIVAAVAELSGVRITSTEFL